jgi:regulator of sigma E protease
MNWILSSLSDLSNLLLVVLGFSLIIVIHELGHFLAARWAGIRVLAFAVGFGPALVSYRKGLGWRRGSSEAEYKKIVGECVSDRTSTVAAVAHEVGHDFSPTEYRLNILPFGGYVKMLGQDDIDPTARSSEPDSYQNCKPWKRMIVISAGVTANLITAAILFVAVFMLGLPTEPAKIGLVEPGSPAATTVASNAAALGVTSPGLKPADEIVGINGDEPLSFNDLVLASAMARAGSPVNLDVRRAGVDGILHFSIIPVQEPVTKMLYIGAGPAASAQLTNVRNPDEAERFRKALADRGVTGIEPGMTLVSLNGRPARSAYDLAVAVEHADGTPITANLTDASGRSVTAQIPLLPRMMRDKFMIEPDQAMETRHLLGLMPVLAVSEVTAGDGGKSAGLQPGDVFARIGATEWPSVPSGVAEIRAARGSTTPVVVKRRNSTGDWFEQDLGQVAVNSQGKMGFGVRDSSELGSWVGTPYAKPDGRWDVPRTPPGSRITAVNARPTATLLEVRGQLRDAVAAGAESVTLTVERPLLTADGSRPTDEIVWSLTPDARSALSTAAWEPALDPSMFQLEKFNLQATGPVDAIGMGLRETQRVMMTTYITFARLFQGTIKVVHLKGPVGIAHVGTVLAERGYVWLLFFMALISVNLAVINFLPIPIADGGHFVFLLYEQFTGKPVSAAVQNFAAIAGLILLATVFLIVTYNDITNLFRG